VEEDKYHPIWLTNADSAVHYYSCTEYNLRVYFSYNVFQVHEGECDGKKFKKTMLVPKLKKHISTNYLFNPILRYHLLTNQMEKCSETKYFIVYDMETMKKRNSNDDLEDIGVVTCFGFQLRLM
jgi:hypothetical protein